MLKQPIPSGKFTRQVKGVSGEGEKACLEIGWKPSTTLFVSVGKCLGSAPKDPVGRHVEFEFDPNSQPSALNIEWFRFV